jgi:hypothetical protein
MLLFEDSQFKENWESLVRKKYHLEIDREPFYCTFEYKKKINLQSFFMQLQRKQPETEIKYFKFLPGEYPEFDICWRFQLSTITYGIHP